MDSTKDSVTSIKDGTKISDRSVNEESKMLSTLVVVIEIINLIGQIFLRVVESTFRIFFPVPKKPVCGEIILITGTGHGMGRELALQYADLGATIICVDINEETNNRTVKDIQSKYPSKVFGYICDVSNSEEVKELAKKVKKEVGIVSVLVNNAGIMPCRQILSYSPEDIQKLFAINVFAHIWLIQSFLPDMLEKNHGHIIALSSMAGMMGLENLAPYCATKFAVRGLMEAISEELRTKIDDSLIKFTVVYPYMVDTGLCKKPVIKFPSLLPPIKPEEAARQIIEAHRRNAIEVTIPSVLLYVNYYTRLWPYKAGMALKDFLGSTLDEHD